MEVELLWLTGKQTLVIEYCRYPNEKIRAIAWDNLSLLGNHLNTGKQSIAILYPKGNRPKLPYPANKIIEDIFVKNVIK